MKKSWLLFLLVLGHTSHADELAPFTSDGCSLFPDGDSQHKNLWLPCCIQHDLAYWMGGNREQRKQADLKLEHCVRALNKPEIAHLMRAGVRAGGTPYLPTSYRWGYGWTPQREYQDLTTTDLEHIKNRLQEFDQLIQHTLQTLPRTSQPQNE